ncbi:hypothetical protein ABW20_dc0109906 [Dactylellina cionopaga]|nr:hypothetical protein ABW20_dc0109906 [Dactylellina cionopaga]
MLLRIFRRVTQSHPLAAIKPARIAYAVPLRIPVSAFHNPRPRPYATTGKRPVDEKVEELSELYASAKDEFEIAVEETAKNTIYAREDRETAREELNKFKTAYGEAIANGSPEDSQEIKRRVGQRLRELDSAVETLNEADNEEH